MKVRPLWSHFRDGELGKARWKSELNGEMVDMKLEQLVTDDQIWRIVREDSEDKEVYGYVLVYIDDLLIQGPEPVLRTFYQWVADKWEVDALDVLDYNHPIRFLGMELHKTVEGFELGQEGFVRELLRAYKHSGARSTSQGQRELLILSHEEEQALLEAEPTSTEGLENEIKQAQKKGRRIDVADEPNTTGPTVHCGLDVITNFEDTGAGQSYWTATSRLPQRDNRLQDQADSGGG